MDALPLLFGAAMAVDRNYSTTTVPVIEVCRLQKYG
jgi:hypothetical protein